MRRLVGSLALGVALVATASASAAFQPIERRHGEIEIPRVRAGTITVPDAHRKGRVTVILTLSDPPLAAYSRSLSGSSATRRLNVQSRSARAYVAKLRSAQRRAAVTLRRAIPSAAVQRNYTLLLNGMAVELPATELARAAKLSFARKLYPSYRYTLALNRSPGLIGAGALAAAGGGSGEGMKIAIVDDGIDQTNRFFDPQGYSYPAGFPKGGTKWTSPKVIVARSFVGAGADERTRLAVDPQASFHGTHVAGIAAGNAGTTAPAGADHPATSGLSGVAPRAYVGNYRVFNVPTPVGHVGNTPEIVAAFEAAVSDGMDVINFSGGGPQTDPLSDALVEAVKNVAAAGVVPVISAGNDRDDYGVGSAGSPGSAPDAISVAALSNAHVYAPALTVTAQGAPEALTRIPYVRTARPATPTAWGSDDQQLVDVGTIVGTNGQPVQRDLCGPPGNLDGGPTTLPANSLRGAIAVVSRGTCTFALKAARVKEAGGVGIVVVDNRPSEANPIPTQLEVPGGMIADLDGQQLRAFLAARGGRTTARIGRDPRELATGRNGVVTSFSSAGLTAFGHLLKPDVGAPGGQILSATLPSAGGPFAVFDGTSMAAPHVAGAAALLLQRHPNWSPHQVKSALVSTAATAWADTARTVEAPVLMAGSGQVDLPTANDPKLFMDPVSLSYSDLNVNRGAVSRALLLSIADGGDGAGTWTIEVKSQAQPSGVQITVPGSFTIAPGGSAQLPVSASAAANAAAGEAYGFLLLRRGTVTRKVPYALLVTRPGLATAPVVPLQQIQSGDTRRGTSRASAYKYPAAAFGPAPNYLGAPVNEDGAERLYRIRIDEPAVNVGAAVIASSAGSLVHPWFLGSPDENDVQGYAGLPVNVNNLTIDYPLDIGAAGTVFPRTKAYYVSVDSGRDPFTGRSLGGSYVLRAWIDDLQPPLVGLLTERVSAGRPTIALRVLDLGAGVDPYSLVIGYGNTLIGAAAYDPASGIALFPIPGEAAALRAGKRQLQASAADFQESKNVDSVGDELLPNTAFAGGPITVVAGPAISWVAPEIRECTPARTPLLVLAGSTEAVRSVRFLDGRKPIATVRRGASGLYQATWRRGGAAKGRHTLRAIVTDAKGRKAEAQRVVRVCA
ncbi:MAG TPA: S8 family serine peptidase [Solirubrobacteraceae bacterium]|nr:S8 family serine peptidase [Solirubrobacteraceae bacterium]